MTSLLAALRFLTILPIPGTWGTSEADLARSVLWFPVVGLLLGAVAAVAAGGLERIAPPMMAAMGTVVMLMLFSGCMHLDGLADSADGLLSSRPRERMLEIMKDSHTGAMGVVAVVVVLLGKFAVLSSLESGALWYAAFLMPLAGRCTVVIHMAVLPYARSSGLGFVFYQKRAGWSALWAALVLGVTGFAILSVEGLVVWAACLVVAFALAGYVYRKLAGATGDTLGAACEIVELVPALVLSFQPLDGMR